MRDFKGMKRQRSRNRNSGGGGGGGGKPQQNANRAFDSNGPEGVKVRGAAQGVYEKYQQLARDAQTSGDRVLAENYLQHAEHYFRLMRAMQPQRPLSEIIGRDQFVSGYDIDFEDESGQNQDGGETEAEAEAADFAEAAGERPARFDARQGDGRQNDFRQGEYRQSDNRQSDNRQVDTRQGAEQPRAERAQGDRAQGDRVQGDRVQSDRSRDNRPRFNRDDRPIRADRTDRDPLSVIEPEAAPFAASASPSAPAQILRADDGEISHAPAFLQVRASEPRAEGSDEARRPRRRRAPASFRADEATPAMDVQDD